MTTPQEKPRTIESKEGINNEIKSIPKRSMLITNETEEEGRTRGKKKRKAVRHSKKSNYTSQEHSEGMMASKD